MTTNDVSTFFFLNPWKEAADTGNIRFGLLVSTVESVSAVAQMRVTVQVSVFRSMCSIMCFRD